MKGKTRRLKLWILVLFTLLGLLLLSAGEPLVVSTSATSDGPPPGFTGAPDESNCTACHANGPTTGGSFVITPPAHYVPGQTYQIQVQHVNADMTLARWGFEMTALTGINMAGAFSTVDSNTQTITDSGRQYIEHTLAGSFGGQTGGATWTMNWTAPATNVGPIAFYAAGNQANNNGGPSGDRIILASAISQPLTTPYDFDGDRKTDIAIFRPAGDQWWITRSSDSSVGVANFGSGGVPQKITPADFTGDGKTDVAFWRESDGIWYILRSEDFSFFTLPFGATGDIPAPADFDGDLKADLAVYRPSSQLWFIRRSTDSGATILQFGAATDLPVPADYDGDGKADIAIFRPFGVAGAEWWLFRSSDSQVGIATFGSAGDKAVPADFTGDGKADIAFWRPSDGFWFVLRSNDFSFYSVPFGAAGDIPIPGDYDGDGKADTAVFRPSNATWFAQRSSGGTLITTFGATGDTPVPSAFVRN
jgi:hypothetical protein